MGPEVVAFGDHFVEDVGDDFGFAEGADGVDVELADGADGAAAAVAHDVHVGEADVFEAEEFDVEGLAVLVETEEVFDLFGGATAEVAAVFAAGAVEGGEVLLELVV
jgi:hypothetical protein